MYIIISAHIRSVCWYIISVETFVFNCKYGKSACQYKMQYAKYKRSQLKAYLLLVGENGNTFERYMG